MRTGSEGLFSRTRRKVPLSLAALRRAPHGIDLGPLEPALPARLFTRNHRIALAPKGFIADLDRLRAHLASDIPSLVLIGRRDLRTNNSWMHNSERFVKGRDRCTLLMHPDDASSRGLTDAQRVRVNSRVGEVHVALEITDAMMPGVVSLPHGWGHANANVQLRVARAHPGASVNDLTDDRSLDTLSGNASLSGVPVDVTAD